MEAHSDLWNHRLECDIILLIRFDITFELDKKSMYLLHCLGTIIFVRVAHFNVLYADHVIFVNGMLINLLTLSLLIIIVASLQKCVYISSVCQRRLAHEIIIIRTLVMAGEWTTRRACIVTSNLILYYILYMHIFHPKINNVNVNYVSSLDFIFRRKSGQKLRAIELY